jgi:hypothetical protein
MRFLTAPTSAQKLDSLHKNLPISAGFAALLCKACSNSQKNQKWTSAFLPEVAQGRMLSFSLCSRQTILPEGGKL